jgi:hypothetical protein
VDVRTKLRLLNRVRKVFPEWAIERQAIVLEHAFDADLATAKNSEARQELEAQRDAESSEYWEQLAELQSHKLIRHANKRHIPLDGLIWHLGNYGNRYLDAKVRIRLYNAIREEKRKTWEFRMKLIGALTGLVGTIIGLVAILKRK